MAERYKQFQLKKEMDRDLGRPRGRFQKGNAIGDTCNTVSACVSVSNN